MVAPAMLLPLSFHWYAGIVPPLVGVAVKVTDVPAQIVLSASLDVMLTLTGRFGFTVVLIELLVAGFPLSLS